MGALVRDRHHAANELLEPIHERMPVVLDEDDVGHVARSLRRRRRDARATVAPAPDEWFDVYPVSTRVNKPDNNDADLLQPVSP